MLGDKWMDGYCTVTCLETLSELRDIPLYCSPHAKEGQNINDEQKVYKHLLWLIYSKEEGR